MSLLTGGAETEGHCAYSGFIAKKGDRFILGGEVERENTSRPEAGGVFSLYDERVYCFARPTNRISTRRFCARPFLVVLLAIGIVSPIPVIAILLSSTP